MLPDSSQRYATETCDGPLALRKLRQIFKNLTKCERETEN